MAESPPRSTCPECGAAVPEGGTCLDNFHALLLLESEVPGGPGRLPHFYAVASYGLQHPGSMNYTVEVAQDLRASVTLVLDGRATLADIRRRTGRSSTGRPARPGGPATRRWGGTEGTGP